MERMKQRVTDYIWWPLIQAVTEKKLQSCAIFKAVQNDVPPLPLQPCKMTLRLFEMARLDFSTK